MCTEVTLASHYVHRSYTSIPLCAQKLHWHPTMCTEVTLASHYVHRSYTGIPLCAQKLHWRPTMCTDLSYTRVPLGVKMLTSVFQSAGKVLSIPPLCRQVLPMVLQAVGQVQAFAHHQQQQQQQRLQQQQEGDALFDTGSVDSSPIRKRNKPRKAQ